MVNQVMSIPCHSVKAAPTRWAEAILRSLGGPFRDHLLNAELKTNTRTRHAGSLEALRITRPGAVGFERTKE